MSTCVHCGAEVELVDVPNAQPHHPQQAWSDGKIHPFYCPKALDLTHHVLDVSA